MTGSDQQKPEGKSGRRKQGKARKADRQKPKPDRAIAVDVPAEGALAWSDIAAADIAVTDIADLAPAEAPETPTAETPTVAALPMETAAPADTAPAAAASPAEPPAGPPAARSPAVGIQTIASAYRDYTRKSFAEAQTFVEKLSGARSLDKAMELQTEFAKQACETFSTDAQKIRELYRELFWQTFRFPNWPPGPPSR